MPATRTIYVSGFFARLAPIAETFGVEIRQHERMAAGVNVGSHYILAPAAVESNVSSAHVYADGGVSGWVLDGATIEKHVWPDVPAFLADVRGNIAPSPDTVPTRPACPTEGCTLGDCPTCRYIDALEMRAGITR